MWFCFIKVSTKGPKMPEELSLLPVTHIGEDRLPEVDL